MELQKSACYQHNCVDGIWNGSEQEKNEHRMTAEGIYSFTFPWLACTSAGLEDSKSGAWNGIFTGKNG